MTGKKGLRCQICTGCGLCRGVIAQDDDRKIHILAGGEGAVTDLENSDGIRLIAADIGTTTIAMELYRTDGSVEDRYVTVNPQVKFGSDVLSRITASEKEENRKELRECLKSALTNGVKRFLKWMGEGEKPVMVIAANTAMSYFLMGWDAAELGQAPFLAGHLAGGSFLLACQEKEVSCLLLPGFSAFVGGDLFAGVYFTELFQREELTLLIDLGTNGELVLGNRERILATATAAGPAFEGGANRGIWGADMVRFTAILLEQGMLNETGLLQEPYFTRGIRVGNVRITQESIRGLQLSKAAIAAGIGILAQEYGCAMEDLGRVILAGGFGYYLHPEDAVRIGMLPEKLGEMSASGGNTALLGARKIGERLIKKGYWTKDGWERERTIDPGEAFYAALEWKGGGRVRCINLAQQASFAEEYVKKMALSPL